MQPAKQPLRAILTTAALAPVSEHDLPEDMTHFPDMIELEHRLSVAPDLPSPYATFRRFFKFQVSDRRGYYREGTSYRISQ
jgi:hypothetical protein